MLEARDVDFLWHALFGRAGRHAGCQFMEPKRASLLFACREIQAGYVPAATMNFNASAATSRFKWTSSHAGLLFANQIGSILRVGMQRNRPFAGSC